MHSIKNLFYSIVCLSFLITSCSEDDKEHKVEKRSSWTQTIGETTHIFRLYWKGGWAGNGKEYMVEHGECSYHSYPKGEHTYTYWGFSYWYERDGDSIKIYENVYFDPRNEIPDSIVWLKGHIANDIMFLSNDTLTFQLQQVDSYEDIQ